MPFPPFRNSHGRRQRFPHIGLAELELGIACELLVVHSTNHLAFGRFFFFVQCLKPAAVRGRACGDNSVTLARATLERRPRQAKRTPRGRHFLRILLHLPIATHVHVADIPHRLDVVPRRTRNRDVVINGANASNDPPRGELRHSPNDEPSYLFVSFENQGSFCVFSCVGPEQDLQRLPSVDGQVFGFVGKKSP